MRTKLWTTLTLVALVAALAGCGGGTTPSPSAATGGQATEEPATTDDAGGAAEATPATGGGTLDACALLTTDQVKQITGADTKAGQEEGSGLSDWVAGQCWWNSSDMKVRFSIDVGTPDSIAKSSSPTAKEQLEVSRLAFGAFGKVEDVAIGDGAIYAGGFLVAIKGGSMVQLYALNMDKQQEIELTKLVVEKL